MQGYIATSQIEKSACDKMLWFVIWSIFFANVLTGSATSLLQIILDPKEIPVRLAVVVPAQVRSFISFLTGAVLFCFAEMHYFAMTTM